MKNFSAKFKKASFQNHTTVKTRYHDYRRLFCKAVNDCRDGNNLDEVCVHLFSHESVIRCYMLDPSGIQIGPTVVSPRAVHRTDPRFAPLHDMQKRRRLVQKTLSQACSSSS